jgi:hypothetical protein
MATRWVKRKSSLAGRVRSSAQALVPWAKITSDGGLLAYLELDDARRNGLSLTLAIPGAKALCIKDLASHQRYT